MKAMVTIKSLSRGNKGDSIKFIDDATGQLPPVVTLRGGAKDGERFTPKALRYAKEPGRLVISSNGRVLLETAGELQRVDAWEQDEDGELEATASLTFTMTGRLTHDEIAGLFSAESLALAFEPNQKAIEFKDGKAKGAA